MPSTSDLRIRSVRPLITPAILEEELPLPEGDAAAIARHRAAIASVIQGNDDRLLAGERQRLAGGGAQVHGHRRRPRGRDRQSRDRHATTASVA